ncbi:MULTISPECIES: Tfp pilus assembly protein FimT/FimU [Desulfonatronum]|uniref:pilus assembly FimT family protein n=1 Tax=Desulfonatronum TaxID=66848 RepID=UPI0004ABD7E5|nr:MULTISPECIES: prepilin-type N-terminal cleavage/methylation domain-containing protein [Desulfonatronum]
MKRSDASPQSNAGLTLVELLIVLFIVGLGWFTLLPRLDPTRPSGSNAPLHEVNVFLAQVRSTAIETGRFQAIRLDPTSGVLSWNEATHRLPTPPGRCVLNDSPCPHPAAHFRVYPQGHMDRLRLDFSSGERWTTADLDVRLINEFRP